MLFRDRVHAAGLLCERLAPYRGTRPLVAGDPLMARELAAALGGDVDVPPAGRVVLFVVDAVPARQPFDAELRSLREAGAERVALATAVARPGPWEALRGCADELVCLALPRYFGSASRFFVELSEERVPAGAAR